MHLWLLPVFVLVPRYRGLRQERVTGDEYDSFVAEFMEAVARWQPHMLVQFEDLGRCCWTGMVTQWFEQHNGLLQVICKHLLCQARLL